MRRASNFTRWPGFPMSHDITPLAPDCSGTKPLDGPLKQELEEALAMAERLTQEYDKLIRKFEEKMFNTSSLLDMLNKQFGWVSALADKTKEKDGIFQIETVSF